MARRAGAVARTEWLWPWWLERQLDPESPSHRPIDDITAARNETARTWTAIATLDAAHHAVVDQRGLVTPGGANWSLDWWIGAADRWHFPSREVAVRQRLLDDTPVVETAMRVPGGDVVHRVCVARLGADEVLVVEIENDSPTPVALALAIRPATAERVTSVPAVELRDTTVVIDGRAAVVLPRPPSDSAVDAVDEAIGLRDAAFVFPLTHRTTIRVVLPLSGGAVEPQRLPAPAQVARGWQAHAARGVRFVLPDAEVGSGLMAGRCHLLALHHGAPHALAALSRLGHATDAADALRAQPDRAWGGDGGLVAVTAEHWRLHRDVELLEALVPLIAASGERVARTGRGRQALVAAAELLAVAGEQTAATDARRQADRAAADDSAIEEQRVKPTIGALLAALDDASPTWTWPDGDQVGGAAAFVDLVRAALVRETDDGLALCSLVPESWLGQPIELHDAPTHAGRLAFAVRWHGERPALLWELDAHDPDGVVRLTAPGLDPTWSSTERRGEALLGPVAPPGTPVRLGRRSS